MAAPHVAGALALLLSAYPGLTAAQQEAALEQGAQDLGPSGPDNSFGFGRLDVLGAYNAASQPGFSVSVSPSSGSTAPGGSVPYSINGDSFNGFSGSVALSLSGLSAAQATWAFAPAEIVGGSGASQLTIATASSLPVGSYPITITATSGSTTHTVDATLVVSLPANFSLSATPSSVTVTAGLTATYPLLVSSLNGFSGDVVLSLGGLPASGASASFSPATVNGGSGSSQFSVQTSTTLAAGTYPLTVTGTSGAISHPVGITLVVLPAVPDFTISVSPASKTLKRKTSTSFVVTVTPVGGFTGKVSLSLSTLPGSVTGTLSSGRIKTSGSVTLSLTASKHAALGTFTLTVTGAYFGTVHTAAAAVTVTT